MNASRLLPALGLALTVSSVPAMAGAQTPPAHAPSAPTPWSELSPDLGTRIRSGHPLVIAVVVPLCSNDQIDCGASWAGQAGRLETNPYWGAVFGAKRFLLRPRSGWDTVEISAPADGVLEQAVFRRRVPGAPWGTAHRVEVLALLQAIHGDRIDDAVDRFWGLATQGGTVRFQDGDHTRTEQVSVAGYAGHNRLMDGKRLPRDAAAGQAIPSSCWPASRSGTSVIGSARRALPPC